jgi:hypothetical protein
MERSKLIIKNNMKLVTLNLTKVYINDKDKEGKKFVSKNGKSFWKIAVKAKEYDDKYISNIIFDQDDDMFNWTPNQVVKVIIEKNGNWLNFKVPTKLDSLEMRIQALEDKIAGGAVQEEIIEEPPMDEGEIRVEDLPF